MFCVCCPTPGSMPTVLLDTFFFRWFVIYDDDIAVTCTFAAIDDMLTVEHSRLLHELANESIFIQSISPNQRCTSSTLCILFGMCTKGNNISLVKAIHITHMHSIVSKWMSSERMLFSVRVTGSGFQCHRQHRRMP